MSQYRDKPFCHDTETFAAFLPGPPVASVVAVETRRESGRLSPSADRWDGLGRGRTAAPGVNVVSNLGKVIEDMEDDRA